MLRRVAIDNSFTAWSAPQALTSRARGPRARKATHSKKSHVTPLRACGGVEDSESEGFLTDVMVALQQGDMTPMEAARLVGQRNSRDFKEKNIMKMGQNEQFYPEIVVGTGKTPQQVADKMAELSHDQPSVLAVRISPIMYAAIRKLLPGVRYHAGGETLAYKAPDRKGEPSQARLPGSIAIVAGDMEDNLVAEECRMVAEHLGCYCFKLNYMKSSSLKSIVPGLEGLQSASVVVVISGRDRALANVLAGIVASPVISVPTSAGHKSETAATFMMSSVLSSMSLGVTVVGMDDGSAAAFSSARVLEATNRINKLKNDRALKLAKESAERATSFLTQATQNAADVPSAASTSETDGGHDKNNIDINSWGSIDSDSLSLSSMRTNRNGRKSEGNGAGLS